MKVINNRYHVIDTLSKESSVVEYLVEDVKKNHQIKRMRIFDAEISNYDFVRSMEENFVDISTYIHENLLSAYEFKPIYTVNGGRVTRKQFFYTYEHYENSNIVAYYDLNKSEINSVISQLCKIVRFLHFRGVVYKYLNFNSIIILKIDGKIKVKLKDIANNYINDYFIKVDHERYQQFIAPEVLWGDELGYSADVYSLGVLFYYLYYRVDFNLKSIKSIFKNTNATDIHRFIMKASNHIKEERHQSIREFIEELTRLIWIEIDNNDLKYYDKIQNKTKIIGRNDIIEESKDIIFEKMKKIESYSGIYIQGENGMGKSRILKELEYIAKFNRIAYVTINTKKSNGDSFYAIKEIIAFIATQDDVSPMIIQKYGQELVNIYPEIANRWNVKETEKIDVEEQKLRLLNRAFNFFVEYTSNKYMVILLDNEELLDPNERYFFDQLVYHKGHINYMLIFTGVDQERPYQKVADTIKCFRLPYLNLEETGIIVQKSLGMNSIPYRFTHRIMLETMGKPRGTKKLVKQLWYDDEIFFDQERFEWNLDKVDDSYKFDYLEEYDQDVLNLIRAMPIEHVEILKKLSALNGSFNMNVLLGYAEIDEETAYYFIFEMETNKIINKRISDVEYVFGFYKNEVKKYFYDSLTQDEIKKLSHRASEIYENRYYELNEINETLIEYLITSEEYTKAAEYSIKFAEYYLKKSNSHKGIDLLEQACQLFSKFENERGLIDVLKLLILNYTRVGKIEKATEKTKILIQLCENLDVNEYINAQLEYANILYYKNDLNSTKELANKYFVKSKEQNYIEGELKAVQILCKCLAEEGDLSNLQQMVEEYKIKAEELNDEKYKAIFNHELGRYFHLANKFEESIEAFKLALRQFEALGDEEHAIKIYNNFGVIYLDDFGDYIAAREYFRKAYNKSNSRNFYVSTPLYLNNLGETYLIEGRYSTAIKYFEEAFLIAENVGDKNMVVSALLNLCKSTLAMEDYGRVHTLINRLEHEFNVIKSKEVDNFDYYIIHFEYYLAMNSILKAEKWRYEFNADRINGENRRFKIKVVDLLIEYRKSIVVYNSRNIPRDAILGLCSEINNSQDAMILRHFLLDIMIDSVERNEMIDLSELVKIDNQLERYYNTKYVKLKRDFIDACMDENGYERLYNLLPQIKAESNELLWRTYKYLGDEDFYSHNQFGALKYYLMALDVVADLSHEVSIDFKETYILYDDAKMSLKSRINRLIKLFLNFEENIQAFEERIDTVEDYFNLSNFNLLYQSKSFIKFVYENYNFNMKDVFHTSSDLIKSLGKNEKDNLFLILMYFINLTIAERGAIYILDENDEINEVIKSSPDIKDYDIMRLINSTVNDLDGMYISKLNSETNIQLLTNDQKGIIFFPIYESDNDKKKRKNRREDILIIKKRIVGYVFLDTKNVINRFNQDSFSQCKSFMNLTYLMIDNYNLKLLSSIDKLTGVQLRKSIELDFARELNHSRQNNINLSVIMLDIDKFKNVNDTYGHRRGDEILSKIGALIKDSVRNTDYVGRYGGEEFIIILPDTNALAAYKVSEKIRTIVEQKKLLGEEMPLTVSLGISSYPEDGVNEEELIEKADQALYFSKSNGRNQSNNWNENIIKAGHRYDKLAGILTGNISSDTRNIQALTDILSQLSSKNSFEERVKNTFITLLDITEGDEICFICLDENGEIEKTICKKKGVNQLQDENLLNSRLIRRFANTSNSSFFIDWEENVNYDETSNIPNWKSYIVLSYNDVDLKGVLSISVPIHIKEMDFNNFNFVETLKDVIKYILLLN